MTTAVGNYRLVEKLGEGGMGAVYKGVDLMVERDVAIKMLRPEIARQPEILERFRAEAVALAKLNHPNIATLYSFFREGDQYFMVMEFVTGRTLDAIIRNSPPMPIGEAVALSAQVLDAIEHAHCLGILHRDIKPANIMLTASGQVKVTDFGIARVLGKARMTREGLICGTLEYLAPERIRGQEGDIRSDLYSMGVVLYELLSRHLPFERDSEYELMRAHLEETPPPLATFGLASIPAKLEMAVARALAKKPEERFATAGEFRSALAGADWERPLQPAWPAAGPAKFTESAPLAVVAPPATAEALSSIRVAVPAGRPRWAFPAVMAVLLVLVGVIFALFWTRKHDAVEATRPPPAPAAAQPSTPAVQPQVGRQADAASSLSAPARGAGDQDLPKSELPAPGKVLGPVNSAVKAKSQLTPPEPERRKAALKALDKDEAIKPAAMKESQKDRRSSSLDALKK